MKTGGQKDQQTRGYKVNNTTGRGSGVPTEDHGTRKAVDQNAQNKRTDILMTQRIEDKMGRGWEVRQLITGLGPFFRMDR